jgi:hypothetical protein
MLYTQDDYRRPNGQIFHTYPSLKSQADQDELWAGARDGSIACVATDEICCSLSLKVAGDRIDDTRLLEGGNNQVRVIGTFTGDRFAGRVRVSGAPGVRDACTGTARVRARR